MKTKLKQNGGFAIVYVIFFLMVLSLMGTAMYLYSVTSMRSVRYLSDRKKAEYLAQAGVESAAYAYQLAVSSSGSDTVANQVALVTSSDTINSNTVYMVYDRTASANNHYKFVTNVSAYDARDVIGYYTVKITNTESTSTLNKNFADNGGYPVTVRESMKRIEATGYAYGNGTAAGKVSAKKAAELSEPVQALGRFYGNDGIIDGSTNGTKNVTYVDADGNTQTVANVPKATNENFETMGSYSTGTKLKVNYSLFTHIPFIGRFIGISSSFEIPIAGTSQNASILLAYTTGNMIMNEPTIGEIKFKPNQNNFVSFVGKNNLFVNTSIDVTPSKTHFNVMYLRGNTIALNGDVDIYVYGYQRSSANLLTRLVGQNNLNMYNAIAGNYCMSTVVIGTSNLATASAVDNFGGVYSPHYTSVTTDTNGNVTNVARPNSGYGTCGKIFFGGNVFVNVDIPNVGVYRYKAFNAGDAYYYDDDLPQASEGEEGYGIDLFKYFVDNAIATKRYSDNVLSRLAEVMAMYYSTAQTSEPTTYVIGDANGQILYNAMRRISKEDFNDRYVALIPPDPTDSSSMTWVLG